MDGRWEMLSVFRANIAGVSFTDPEDFYRIGKIYALGKGRPASLVEGYVWLRYAASHGSRRALGLLREITGEMERAELHRAREALRLLLDGVAVEARDAGGAAALSERPRAA